MLNILKIIVNFIFIYFYFVIIAQGSFNQFFKIFTMDEKLTMD